MIDWTTVSALATGGGTLVLAVATFSSVRSANRAARVAERSLLAGLRPLLTPSRLHDPPEKISFNDSHWVRVDGGHAALELTSDVIYLAIALRNVGSGMAVLHGWHFYDHGLEGDRPPTAVSDFERQNRDIYVPAGDLGFWQAAYRDPGHADFQAARRAIEERRPITVELLYGDHEGGQRMISRFMVDPIPNGSYLTIVGRHWNIDRANPRD